MVGVLRLGVFSVCALAATTSIFAQVAGSISGSVTDASGAAIANAAVGVYQTGGASALLTSKTNTSGLFTFVAVQPGTYDVAIEMSGFARYIQRQVKVDPIRETSLGVVKLEVSTTQQTIEVAAEALAVQLANSEVSTTITRQQITNLPVLDRQVSVLYKTQAGVSDGRGPTVINGLRTSGANVTLDGVNVQDNFIRTNSLDYQPLRTTVDQISEMTIAVSNAATAVGGGAAQIALVTRSGGNDYHGSGYWYNRNNAYSANDWFNNRAGVPEPSLNLNQVGAALGGRIIRDKLFFYVNYEVFRLKEQQSTLRTTLLPDARNGIFRYRDTGSVVQEVNLLTARNVRPDPTMAALIQQLGPANTTDAGDQLNTSGHLFNANANTDRNQWVSRFDYYKSERHSFTGTYNYTSEKTNRPDLGNFYGTLPPVFNDNHNNLVSGAWRWNVAPTLTNEVRGGFNLGPGTFNVRGDYPAFLVTVAGTQFSTPQNRFLKQGRATDTYTIQDNANFLKGRHDLQFGFQTQFVRTAPFNDVGILADYTLGISAANQTGFTAAQLPGIRAQDVAVANNLYSNVAGIITSGIQSFNVTSRTSGFVPGATNLRHFTYDNYAGYIQDKFKATRKLTLSMGVRYEYWPGLDERDSLFLLPEISGNFVQTLLSNATFNFAGKSAGRPFYKSDRNNFAPNAGFAFDPFGTGKTAIRGGYSISFINDDSITAIRNNVNTNPGLNANRNLTNQTATLANRPQIPAPAYKVPRTQADNYALDSLAALGLPDPNLRTPYAQQFSFGIQHNIKGSVLEVRYVGNHGTKLLRAFDYNQVVVKENGFVDDVRRARNNGFLALAQGLGFNPAYNPNIAGSQPLTVFPRLESGGLLTNATIQNTIRTGEAGTLGELYQTNGLNGPINFFRNPLALGANTIVNGADSTYNALQVDLRRQTRTGLFFQANYTYAKVLSNGIGDDQARFEPYLDLENPAIERSRAPFDITHAIKMNSVYELPFGKGKHFGLEGPLNHVLGGWRIGGVMIYQSGTPFSIFSNRGTLNRGGRATGRNTATALLTKSELDQRVGRVFDTGSGLRFIDPSAVGTDGRGTSSDGVAPFAGQLFFNPDVGGLGALQRRMFSGPWNFNMDLSLQKTFRIREHHSLQFQADAFNFLNNPSFWVGSETTSTNNFNINNANFGRITSTFNDRRIVQFSLYYRF